MAAVRLSIVIPTYNGRAVLEPCLNSIATHPPADAEVIVVDDGSTDGTADWLREQHPWARLVRLEKNRGFCAAMNAGIDAARGEFVESLNNDTVVTAGWADAALKYFDNPMVGSVAPLVLTWPDGQLVDSAGDAYHISGWSVGRGHREPVKPELLEPVEVFGASASAGFFRREALLAVGGFPEHFGAYYDDVDLAFRLRWAGFRCLYAPDSRVYHRLHGSYDLQTVRSVRRAALNEERVFWTNLPGHWLLPAVVPHLIYVTARAARTARYGRLAAYISGKLDLLREVAWVRKRRATVQSLAPRVDEATRFPLATGWGLLWQRMRWR